MAHDHEIVATQELIFRVALRGGLTLKAISIDAGIPYNTVRSYAGSGCATAEMPVSAVRKLAGVIPDELLSLLLPEGRCIVQIPAHMDYDEFAVGCRDFTAEKDRAHHPDSPAGREISDCEAHRLRSKVVHLTLRGKVA